MFPWPYCHLIPLPSSLPIHDRQRTSDWIYNPYIGYYQIGFIIYIGHYQRYLNNINWPHFVKRYNILCTSVPKMICKEISSISFTNATNTKMKKKLIYFNHIVFTAAISDIKQDVLVQISEHVIYTIN